ncbi:MAG TPA: tryptophan--tRNA ligase [Candidatus Bathyarchaeia archaeon]|nr:tryptophan--tRNA ligase [Candidatus Bathyarchaeia archaeon]
MVKQEFVVTPWEVRGVVDYDRLIRDFGTQKISGQVEKKLEAVLGSVSYLVRRQVFFSHRDLNLVLDDHDKGKGFFLYTGRGPSGPMHIGHILPIYFTKWLQDKFDTNVYIQITDDEKFLEEKRNLTFEETQHWARENILDISAVGFNPDKTFLLQDTEFVGHAYPMILKIARRINLSTVRSVFGFNGETNIGFSFYPAIQILPSLFEKRRCLIPSAIDQDPYWRVQRDIAESLGYYKAAAIHSKLVPGLTGIQEKMSSSKPETSIYLSDDDKKVRQKIYRHAFSGGQATLEEHRKLGGNPDVDVPFQWLYMFFEPDDNRIEQIRNDYKNGRLLTGDLKNILVDKVTKFLQEHRERRQRAGDLVEIYKKGGKLAQEMWKRDFSKA